MRQIRTDLAMEAASGHESGALPGVSISSWEEGSIEITEVHIHSPEGSKIIGKPEGHYVTLECEGVRRRQIEARSALGALLGEELTRLLPPPSGAPVLVVGLGNRMITPDALGPLTVDGTLVTRHLFRELPHLTSERMDTVCAIAPGVLGITGVETLEMVRSVAQTVRPRALIAVDSLAARSISRVGSTVQLTDTGIQPGSGVGNHRSALTQQTVGVPVIAVGIPMVIYASAIIRDALEQITPAPAEADRLTDELLHDSIGEMIVTPREVDTLVRDAAQMLSRGINCALHPGLSEQEILSMLN